MSTVIKFKKHTIPEPQPYQDVVKALKLDEIKLATVRGRQNSNKGQSLQFPASNDGKIPESGRNNALMSIAGSMRRRGMGVEAIEAGLQAENLLKCVPPLDESEVSAIARSVMRYAPSADLDVARSLTDVGNAERFVETHAENVRHVPGMGWYFWTGLHWERDIANRVVELAKGVAKSIYNEGDHVQDADLRVAVAKHAKASQNAARISAMIELAKSDSRIVVEPAKLDTNDKLLGVANGVLDLKTGRLRAAVRDDFITRHSPVEYNKKAKAPQFEQFLDTVTQGNKQLQTYLQRIVGYSLTGLTDEQCLFFLYGAGANGKSTFLNIVADLLGRELSAQTPTETLMTNRSQATNDLARLQGVRVVIANEIEDGSMMAESLVKQLTGGDMISARFHYQEFFEFKPKFKLFIAGNHKPIIRGRDNGIWRRIHLIPFTASIPAGQRDKSLGVKLKTELPGILNWALTGCRQWQKSGLCVPTSVQAAVDDYRSEMDIIGKWIEDRCEQGPTLTTAASDAYRSYKSWSEDNGYRTMSSGAFGREFEQRFKKVKRKEGNFYLDVKCGYA